MSATTPAAERRHILERIAPGNLFQPATVLWRLYEIEAVLQCASFEGRVLDLGCGDGTLSKVIFGDKSACTLIGLEPDSADAEAARRSGLYATVHCAAGNSIPEANESFDAVFSNSVLEHIPLLEPVLAEVARVTRPGGRFVVTVPSEQFHRCLAGRGLLPLLWRMQGRSVEESIDHRLQHHRYWSPDEWDQALRPLGFSVLSVHRYLPAAAVQAWERLSNLTGGLAFELFAGKSATRGLQRRLGLGRLESSAPPALTRAILAALLRSHLDGPPDGAATPSGGLMLIAAKSSVP